MKVYFWETNHPVYNSIVKVFSNFSLKRYRVFQRLRLPTTHIEDSNFPIQNDGVYLVNTPLLSLYAWKIRIKKAPAIIIEESWGQRILGKIRRIINPLFTIYPHIAMVPRVRQFLLELGVDVIYLPPGEKHRPGEKEREYILMVSRLTHTKNIELFLKLVKAFPKEKFLLIGEGPLKEIVERFLASHKNLEYIPYIEKREDLFKIYAKAKTLIHPAYKDPIGFVVIEALSTYTPVLASAQAGASDFLPREWVLDPYNFSSWKEALDNLLKENNPSKVAHHHFKLHNLDIDGPYYQKIRKEIIKRFPQLEFSENP